MFSGYSVIGAKGKEGKEGACALDVEQEGSLDYQQSKTMLKNAFG